MKCAWQRNTQTFVNGGHWRRCWKEGARCLSHQENKRAIYRWMKSSNTQLISKVSGSYPQILLEHLPGMKGALEIPWPPPFKVKQPKPSLNKDLALFPSDTSRAEVILASCRPSKYTGALEVGQLVINLITCQERGWWARLPYSDHTQRTQKPKLSHDIWLKSVYIQPWTCVLAVRSLSISERPSIQEANETSHRAETRNEYMCNTARPPARPLATAIPFGGGKYCFCIWQLKCLQH